MSDINEFESHDSEVNNSEVNHSEFEAANEIAHTHEQMSSAEFEEKLTQFFTKHKEKKLKFVPQIVETFKGHEEEVLEHLHNKYVLGIVGGKKKKAVKAGADHGDNPKKIEAGKPAEAAKPKSKKGLIIIIIISVVVVALGVVGFMMKDKLFGKHEAEKVEVKTEGKAEGAEKPKEAVVPKVEATDSTKAASDSTKTAPADTTKK